MPYQGWFEVLTLKPLESNVFWVRDLIDEESHKRNIPLLERTFNNYDIEQNLQIPLDNHDEENALMWMMRKKGTYKVKIGYHWFHVMYNRNETCTSKYQEHKSLWKSFGIAIANLKSKC